MDANKKIKSNKYQGVYIYKSTKHPGDETYYINYRDGNGKVVMEKVGKLAEGYTQKKADTIRRARIQSIRHGVELPAEKKPIPTFAENFEFWREHQSNKGIKNLHNLICTYGKHLQKSIGSYRLDQLTPKIITELTGTLLGKLKDGTIRNIHMIIRSSLRYAIQTDEIPFIGPNPMDRVKTPRGFAARQRYLTKEEAQSLLTEMKLHGPEHYLFTAIGLFTGMRLSEILNLTGMDIDVENGTINVQNGKGAGQEGKARQVEVPRDLMDTLKQIKPGPDEKLFTGEIDGQRFRMICTKLGLNKGVKKGDRINSVSAHTLRHTYGSWLAQAGTPIMVIKELMGHSDFKTTERYAKLAPRPGQDAAGRLTNGFKL